MRVLTAAVCASIGAALLAGCSGGILSTPSSAPLGAQGNHLINGRFVPGRSKNASLIPVELQRTPAAVLDRIVPDKRHRKKGAVGIYGSTFYNSAIYGYRGTDAKNHAPICSLGSSYVNDFATDGRGNLMVPSGGTRNVTIYRPNCGSAIGVLDNNAYYLGQPSDAASSDALTGTIVVGNIYGLGDESDIAVCNLQAECTSMLTNFPAMYELAGVALAKNGDCWGSASDGSGKATLSYFRHCSGSGVTAIGWRNTYYGGLDIDNEGNIVAVDAFVPQLWIYRGCNPLCVVIAGPFPLHGDTIFGHLNRDSTEWVGGDYANGMLDVYKYSTYGLIYEHSVDNGLSLSDEVEGAAFSRAAKQ